MKILPTWFNRFLVPESEVSLKLIFDNARNYAIAALFLTFSGAIQPGEEANLAWAFGVDDQRLARISGVAHLLFWVLVILNALQSAELGARLFEPLTDRILKLRSHYLNSYSLIIRVIGTLSAVIYLAVVVAIATVIVLSFSEMMLSFVAYSAHGRGAP